MKYIIIEVSIILLIISMAIFILAESIGDVNIVKISAFIILINICIINALYEND